MLILSRRGRSTLALLVILALASCDVLSPNADPEQPGSRLVSPPVEFNAEVGRLISRPLEAGVRDGFAPIPYLDAEPFPGAFWLYAWPLDRRYAFEREAGIRVSLDSSTGDMEELTLSGPSGPCWGDPSLPCHALLVDLEDLDTAYDLRDGILNLGARFWTVAEDPKTGQASLRLLTLDGALRDRRDRLRSWPGVTGVQYGRYAQFDEPLRHPFFGGIPVAFSEARVWDGTLQVDSGGVVLIKYQDESGDQTVTSVQLN